MNTVPPSDKEQGAESREQGATSPAPPPGSRLPAPRSPLKIDRLWPTVVNDEHDPNA